MIDTGWRWRGSTLAGAIAVCAAIAGAAPGAGAQTGPATIVIAAQNVYRGCNSIVVQAPLGTPWPEIVARFSDPEGVESVWQFDNAEQLYRGRYFKLPNAPIDEPTSTVAFVQGLFVCIAADGAVA